MSPEELKWETVF